MVSEINAMCKKMNSVFRTEDGLTLIGHVGGLVFLKREFDSAQDCYRFVLNAYLAYGKAFTTK